MEELRFNLFGWIVVTFYDLDNNRQVIRFDTKKEAKKAIKEAKKKGYFVITG